MDVGRGRDESGLIKIILEENANVNGVVLGKVASPPFTCANCLLVLFIFSTQMTNFHNIQVPVRVYNMKIVECKNTRDLLVKA